MPIDHDGLPNHGRIVKNSITRPVRVETERLQADGQVIFEAKAERSAPDFPLSVTFLGESGQDLHSSFIDSHSSHTAVLSDAWMYLPNDTEWYERTFRIQGELEVLRFLDLSPTQMRIPSLPGQTILGDDGENLSSVLAAICADTAKKETLLEWIRKLTPMDVDDVSFDQDAAGRILLRLKEKNGRNISALSASDGTLRFLGILAALFGPRACVILLYRRAGERDSPDATESSRRSDREPGEAAWHTSRGDQSFPTAFAVPK